MVLLLLLSVASGCAAGVAHRESGSGRAVCESLDSYDYTTDHARPRGGEVVVPVVIHMMAADVPSHNPPWPNHPLDVWDKRTVGDYFGRDSEPGRINAQVWSKIGMRVAVIRVEKCRYSPGTLRHDADGKVKVSVPSPDERAAMEFYDRVNAAYNAYSEPDNRVLDVYLWVKVGEQSNTSAYGTSLKRETAAVWADLFCAKEPETKPETCAWKLAHEILHALSLRHICKKAGIAPNHPDASLAVECGSAQESEESRHNLMRAVNQGDELTRDQIEAVRAWAQQHYGVTR